MSAFSKDVFRSIKQSLGRFLAILIIVALGSGFYAGLRMTAPDMRLSADEYYDGTDLYDINLICSYGISDDILNDLKRIDGVQEVMGAYETDITAVTKSDQYTIRVHSLDSDAAKASNTSDGVNALSDKADYLNRPILVSGQWPSKEGECVLSSETITSSPLSIGDKLQITEGISGLDGVLKTRSYTIVGFVRSSYYSSCENLGTTSLGNGALQQYMFIPATDFDDDFPMTNAFITVSGAKSLLAESDAYFKVVDDVMARIEAQAPSLADKRLQEIKDVAQEELDEKRKVFEDEKAQVEEELAEGARELRDAEQSIAEAETKLNSSAQTLASGERELSLGATTLTQSQVSLEQEKQNAYARFAEAEALIAENQARLDGLAADKERVAQELAALGQQLQSMLPSDPGYAELKTQEAYLQAVLQEMETEWQAGVGGIQEARNALASEQIAATDKLAQAENQIAAMTTQLNTGWYSLEQGRAEYSQGEAALEEGKRSYHEKLADYEEAREKAESEFTQAEAELQEAQDEIDAIEKPEVYVMDRSKNYGAKSFDSDAGRVDQIAQVFPLLFFLVAALVSLTTMTRMVEEERVLIGTFKALGYSRQRIASKFLIYAFIASALGAVIGIAILTQILPRVIIGAYAIMYDIPLGPTPIDPGIGLLSAGLGIGVTCIAAWGAALSTLRERPASLMLPRAPKPGRRILLEQIGLAWKRLSFSWKVTARNIFRYKKRLAMTLIGIAGCTALLLTGLGISDAINDIIPKQFGQIYRYNLTITLADDIDTSDEDVLNDVLRDKDYSVASTRVHTENVTSVDTGNKNLVAQLTVPQTPDSFGDFHVMRVRETQELLHLDKDSALISEKFATELDLNVGDRFTVAGQNAAGYMTDEHHELTVGGIMENYVSHYIIIEPELYRSVFGEDPSFTTIFSNASNDEARRAELSDKLLPLAGVKTVGFNDEVIESYKTALASVDSIVVVLIVAAAALAFVVLYNLTNINITERTREIASLKVLGFTKREVAVYVFREMILLTIIGALIGLFLGVFMESYVVTTAEVDAVMFGRVIHPVSFILAFVLTLVFSLIVAFFMRGKLARIDMVESLKSID